MNGGWIMERVKKISLANFGGHTENLTRQRFDKI